MFANFKFRPSLCIHYLLVLQMAPCISFWNLFLIKSLHVSNRPNNGTQCGNYAELSKSVTKIDHLCIPTVIGFSLMVVLLLASIWPEDENKQKRNDENYGSFIVNKKTEGGGETGDGTSNESESDRDVKDKPHETPADEKDTPSNDSEQAMVNSFKKVFEDRIRTYIIFILGVGVNMPLLTFAVFYYKCHSVERKEFKIVFHATALASKLLLFVLQAVGFTMIPICCNFKGDRVHMFTIGNCLLVFGLWGYSFYQTINFISVLEEAYSDVVAMFLIHKFVSCLTAVQTTVFLLQMKHYEKKINCSSTLKSICVKLSGILFSYWVMDTFIESHGLLSTVECDSHDHTYLDLSGRILYPFLIFFRFQNFLSFYEIYKML